MTKSETRMNDEIRMTNGSSTCHWSLVIGHLFVILISSFVIVSPAAAQLTLPRRAAPATPSGDAAKPAVPAIGAPNQVRGDEITPKQKAAVEKGLVWLANHQ